MMFVKSPKVPVVNRARKLLCRLRDHTDGATAIEYGLLLAGVAVLILVTVFAVGDELSNLFSAVQTKMRNAYS